MNFEFAQLVKTRFCSYDSLLEWLSFRCLGNFVWLNGCPMVSSFCGSCFLQRKRETSSSVLWQMRRQLLLELMGILPTVRSTRIVEEADVEMEPNVSVYSGLKEEHVVKASALLRLYCALMGIAGLKYSIIWYFTFLSFYFLVSNTEKVSQRLFILRIWVYYWAYVVFGLCQEWRLKAKHLSLGCIYLF